MAHEAQKIKSSSEISANGLYRREWLKTEAGKAASERAYNNWMAKHKKEYEERMEVYYQSRKLANKLIPGGVPKGFDLHHAWGMKNPDCFLVMPSGVHKALHSKFGRKNEKCLWENPDVVDFLNDYKDTFFACYKGKIQIMNQKINTPEDLF